ncbi:MAG: FAD-binding oxidoreductase [Planctomycetes bacterium]|nr:FAD-binding oxidoreductase [Planctomycetota bacterium]
MESDSLVESYQAKCAGITFTSDTKELDAHSVDGVPPALILHPQSEAEVSAILSWANEQQIPIAPRGGGTKISLGRPIPQTQEFICLSLNGLDHISEHDAENLTVTAQAGVTLRELQTCLSQQRQLLPLDPPTAEAATVGGVLAANASGPRRFGYGSARDFVLGLKVVTPDGKLLKYGGKSVKNVAGYDMCKLFIGSLGTLAVIVEATFRLVPLPTTAQTVGLSFASLDAAAEAVAQLLASHLLPSAIELIDPSAAAMLPPGCGVDAGGAYGVVLLFEGFQDPVERQVREVSKKNPSNSAKLPPDAADSFWTGLGVILADGTGRTRCKIAVPIASVPQIVSAASDFSAATVCHAGSGIVYALFPPDAKRPDKAISRLRRWAEDAGGHLVVEYAPRDVKEQADVWGRAGSAEPIMHGLRAAFDPNDILNPGRFVV